MRIGVLVASGAAAIALGMADLAYRTQQWGVSARELRLSLPGDGLIGDLPGVVTRGVTVHAAPEQAWRQLLETMREPGPVEVVGERSLVVRAGSDGGGGVARTFHVLPLEAPGLLPEDAARCRLVVRSRPPVAQRPGAATRLAAAVVDPLVAVATRRVLLAVKGRAEAAAGRTPVPTG